MRAPIDGLPPDDSEDLLSRLDALEATVRRLGQPTRQRPIITGDVVATEGETLLLQPSGSGLTVELPQSKPGNRYAIVRFCQLTQGTVRIRAPYGTVNGRSIPVMSTQRGEWEAVSDGTGGWWLPPQFTAAGTALPPFNFESQSVTWAAQQDNFTRSTSAVRRLRVVLTGNQTLTGVVPVGPGGYVAGQAGQDGELLVIDNSDQVDTLTISNENVASGANSRFALPNGVDLAIPPRSGAWFRYDSSNRWRAIHIPTAASSLTGRLLATTVLTAGTGATFNHVAGATRFKVTMVGGGGGGTGCANSGAGAITMGGGGSSGGYAERTFTIGAATSTYTVGAAGAAGASGGAAAGNGTATTWLHNAVTATAQAGLGQTAAMISGTTVAILNPQAGPGVSTNGDVNGAGNIGNPGFRSSGTVGVSGAGGSSIYGGGGAARTTQGNGAAGVAPGAGGAGGISVNAGGATSGGAGFAGIIIVEEYS